MKYLLKSALPNSLHCQGSRDNSLLKLTAFHLLFSTQDFITFNGVFMFKKLPYLGADPASKFRGCVSSNIL